MGILSRLHAATKLHCSSPPSDPDPAATVLIVGAGKSPNFLGCLPTPADDPPGSTGLALAQGLRKVSMPSLLYCRCLLL